MLWIMLRQSWLHDRRRKLLATMTIFLAAGLISALLAISISIGDKMSVEMKSYGANIQITPEGLVQLPFALQSSSTTVKKDDLLLESELPGIKNIFWRNNIIGFAPSVRGNVPLDGSNVPIIVEGTFFDQAIPVPDEPDYHTGHKIISSFWKVDGQWPRDSKPEAFAGVDLAKRKHWQIGDTVRLGDQAIQITGVLTTGGLEDDSLIVPLDIAQQLLGLEGRLESVQVSALTVPENSLSRKAQKDLESLDSDEYDLWFCTAFVSSIAFQLESVFTNGAVRPVWQVAASEGLVIRKIQSLLFTVTLAAFIAAAMGITSLMTNAIIQRGKEIGLMKALGASNEQVYILFYAESIICGLLGGTLGCVAGWGLSKVMGYALFGSSISFNWIIVPVVLLISVIITVCGTYFPSHRIATLYPIEVLYGRQ